MRTPWRRLVLVTLILLVAMAGMYVWLNSRSEGTNNKPTALQFEDWTRRPGSSFDATFTENTVRVDQKVIQNSVRAVSRAKGVLLFDTSAPEIRNLAAGKVLLIPGVAVLKLAAVVPVQSQILVHVEDANITDLIKNGRIKWDHQINFQGRNSLVLARAQPVGPREGVLDSLAAWFPGHIPIVEAAAGSTLSGSLDGWQYTITATPAPDRMNLTLALKKQFGGQGVSGIVLGINGAGYIQNFETLSSINIQDSIVQSMVFSNKNMNGALDFHWSAYTSQVGSQVANVEYKFPGVLKFPFEMAGVPFVFKISGAVSLKAGFTSNNEIVKGGFRVDYNGVEGFALQQGTISEDGMAHGDFSILETPTFSALGPVTMVAGLAFPRLEVALGGVSDLLDILPSGISDLVTTLGNWADKFGAALGIDVPKVKSYLKSDAAAHVELVSVMSVTGSGIMTFPCQDVNFIIVGKGGAHASILTKNFGSVEKEFFRHGETRKFGVCKGQVPVDNF